MAQLKLIDYSQRRKQKERAIKQTFSAKPAPVKLFTRARIRIRTWKLRKDTNQIYNELLRLRQNINKNKISKKQLSKKLNILGNRFLRKKIEFKKLVLLGGEIFQEFDPKESNNHLNYNPDVRAMHRAYESITLIQNKFRDLRELERS